MARDEENNAGEESVDDVEKPKFRLSKFAIILLAVLVPLCVLFVSMSIAGLVYFQKTKALQVEVIALKKELKEKASAQDALKEQLIQLSHQVDEISALTVLRSDAETPAEAEPAGDKKEAATQAATSGKADGRKSNGKENKESMEASRAVASGGAKDVPGKNGADAKVVPSSVAKEEPAIPPKNKRPGGDGFSCDLSGKTQAEQADILKRCVGVMDAPPKARPAGK